MKVNESTARRKQCQAMSKARDWAKGHCPMMTKRAVIEAAHYYPISELQWFNLKTIIGYDEVRELQKALGVQRA